MVEIVDFFGYLVNLVSSFWRNNETITYHIHRRKEPGDNIFHDLTTYSYFYRFLALNRKRNFCLAAWENQPVNIHSHPFAYRTVLRNRADT